MRIEKTQDIMPIPDRKKVKVCDMGHIKEIMYIEHMNDEGFPITKISKTEYVVNETGEVKEYNLNENRSQNKDSLRKTFKHLRHLINYNFGGKNNELAFTITYKENMTDYKRLYKDFEKFFKRLKYKYGNIDYLNVVEPQGRGAWHCHILLRFNDLEKVYIPNKEISQLWGNGFVKVKAIRKDVDNLGAYLSAYLGDVELNDETSKTCHGTIKEVEIDGKKKKFIKGGRLHLYPSGMNIFRKSKGIKSPPEEWMRYEDAKKIVGAVTPNYFSALNLYDDDGQIINTIVYQNYNMKRQSDKMEKFLEGECSNV